MRNARPAARPHLAIALILLLGGLNGGLNGGLSAAPAAPPASALLPPLSSETVIPLTGKIEHITILGNKNISADTIRTDLTSKVGAPYRPSHSGSPIIGDGEGGSRP